MIYTHGDYDVRRTNHGTWNKRYTDTPGASWRGLDTMLEATLLDELHPAPPVTVTLETGDQYAKVDGGWERCSRATPGSTDFLPPAFSAALDRIVELGGANV